VPSTTEYAYQYDDIGNRLSSFDLGTNRIYAANNLNQYSEISTSDAGFQTSEFEPQYDDDGNQTLIQTSTGIWSVTYNGESRPVLWERIVSDSNTQTLVSMQFDRMGRRVSYLETLGSVTNSYKVFTYDGYLQIANSELTTQNSQRFIWDPTEPVATRPLVFYNSNASPQYYTHDGNKNVSDLTDSTQSLAAHYSYTPFGALLSSSGSSSPSNPFRFSSEYADDALGLVYYNYRHCNPEIGRWMRRDPFSYYSGPNLVTFVSNKCTGAFDVFGLAWRDCCPGEIGKMSIVFEIIGEGEDRYKERLDKAFELLDSVNEFASFYTLVSSGVTGSSLLWQTLSETAPSIVLSGSETFIGNKMSSGIDKQIKADINRILSYQINVRKAIYPMLRGWIIYYKCVEGMLWTASWEKVLIGPSAAYAIHTNTSLGKNTINIDVAKRKIEKELKKIVEKEFR